MDTPNVLLGVDTWARISSSERTNSIETAISHALSNPTIDVSEMFVGFGL